MPSVKNKVVYLGDRATNISGLQSYVNQVDSASPIDKLGPLADINILVGANNSGKSRFMRAIMSASEYILFNDIDAYNNYLLLIDTLDKCADNMQTHNNMIFSLSNLNSENRYLEFLNEDHRILFDERVANSITINKDYINTIATALKKWLNVNNNNYKSNEPVISKYFSILRLAASVASLQFNSNSWPLNTISTISYNNQQIGIKNREFLGEIAEITDKLRDKIEQIESIKKIYIPILRTARALLPDSKALANERLELTKIYKQTISKSYGIDSKNINIETGLDFYGKILRNRNDSKENRKLFDDFEEFISNNFFQGKDFEIVARYAEQGDDEHIHISIDSLEHEIHFLGDGIQALIMLLYPVFLAAPESWVFIEEPEVHLHPGMQRLFIETLLKDPIIAAKKLVIFFTTHSNHLLDLAIHDNDKISILSFQKISENKSKFLLSPTGAGELNILNLLEANNSSVFMANCAIWVEGPTDRIYTRKYLNEYTNFKYPGLIIHEDLEYCFFEYAGSNLAHYLFDKNSEEISENDAKQINAWFLSNRIFLISDQDKGKGDKHDKLISQQNDNFVYYVLPVREVENLLSPQVIISSVPPIFGKWGKSKIKAWTESVANNPFIDTDYREEYLGTFLTNKYLEIEFPKTFLAPSGTLETIYKVRLSQHVAKTISWQDMSIEAQSFAERLFNFIVQHNPILGKTLRTWTTSK